MENDAVRSLAEAYGLSTIYLFGSQAETGSRSFKKKIFDKDIMEAIENGYFEFEYSPNP
jgi:hypothetical protein